MSNNVFSINSGSISFPGEPVPSPNTGEMYAPLATAKYVTQQNGKLTVYVRAIVFQDSSSTEVPKIPGPSSVTPSEIDGNVYFDVDIDYGTENMGQEENYMAYYLEQAYTDIPVPQANHDVYVTIGQSKTDPTRTSRGTVVVVQPTSGDLDK